MLVGALLAAFLNWYAVERGSAWLEYIAKPTTTALLLFAALALDPAHDKERWWVVVALVLCLAGDVLLMLPRDRFVAGLAAFLLGHLAFVAAFVADGRVSFWVTAQLVLALVVMPIVARPVTRAVRRSEATLLWPVRAYAFVIGAMFVSAALTRSWLAVAGAATFVVSDTILARHRFVTTYAHGRLATMVTYHAALALLVLALL